MAFKGVLDSEIENSLQINHKFAKSFEVRKRREEIQKAKEKAKDLDIYSGSDVSPSESEDSSAELLTKKADTKFVKILSMIKKGDPRLKDPEFKAFSDSDFETSSEHSEKQQKPIRYKELLTKQILNPNLEPAKNTQAFEAKQIKDDFLTAVQSWEGNDNEDSLFKSRKIEENNDTDKLEDSMNAYANNAEEFQTLKDYWEKGANEDDVFLKKFMLKKLWKDPEDQLMTYNEIVDEEDATNTNEAEKFETAYNFRFEEEGFEKLKTYSRNIDQSVRNKNSSRKTQREAKKEKELQEKTRRSEEIKRLKNLKKQEIASKFSLIEKFGGVAMPVQPELLNEDFDPAEHDKLMGNLYNEAYYNTEGDNPELSPDHIEKVQENDVDIIRIEKSEDLPLPLKEGVRGTWWLCDGCNEGIKENKWRFDCLECPNYTLCENCRTSVVHTHRLKRLKVPLGFGPPLQVSKILCDNCNKDITSDIRYDCCECEDYSLCEDCLMSTNHPHKLKSVQDLWNELEALDYEDLVAGIPVKFKYRQVKAQDYGLTEDEILEWDDKKLNQLVSLKKIAPYREEPKEIRVSKKKKKFVEKSKESKKKPKKSTREDSYKIQ